MTAAPKSPDPQLSKASAPSSPAISSPQPSPEAKRSPWLTAFRPVENPRLRIVCFPYAGAGASAYRLWPAAAPEDVEVLAVQLPGRENRLRDPVLTDVANVVPPLVRALRPLADKVPMVLFGHSMGAAIAHDVARTLIAGGTAPAALVFSGRRPGHLGPQKDPLHLLEEPAFLEAIRQMGGTPKEVFEHPELLEVLIPVLRADFQMSETYARSLGQPFPMPVLILAGAKDQEAPPETVMAWQDLAGGTVESHVYEDGHFFLHPHCGDIIARILRLIASA